ncbi:NADPH:quinone reductase [Natronomonas sp.]|uniref:NADPH:quinone reductase n=1 Tax=Natronomonas sp. TaxID=2184060 RepID=UPI002622B6E1|nr:NADPH:quinone reductase [Natronomonas sp.]
MRAVRYHEFGDPDVLQLEEIPRLDPNPDEVLLAVEAIGVNPCDALRREGLWGDDLPLITGSDVAGTVEAAGDRVSAFAAGDRVFGTIPRLNSTGGRGDRQGACAEYVVVREDRLAPLPDGVSATVGAGIGIVGITAWRALRRFGSLEAGDACLVHGGSGGVGHVAVQLASALGATVIATASDERADAVRSFGADAVIDYDRPNGELEAAIAEVTDGVDVVLDHRIEEYVQLDIDVSGYGGTVVVIGNNRDSPTIEDLTEAIGKDLTIQPMDAFSEPHIDSVLRRLGALLRRDRLTVAVAETYDLEETAAAQRAVMNDSFTGKLVIEP